MVSEKPMAALTLSAVGLALQAVTLLSRVYFTAFWYPMGWSMGVMGHMAHPTFNLLINPFSLALSGAVMVLGVIGLLWMNTSNLRSIRSGSTLVLVASLIALPTMFGFGVGLLLMLIGGILGLTWKPA